MTTTSTARRSICLLGAFTALCVALVSCSAKSTTQASGGTAATDVSAPAGVSMAPGNSAAPGDSAPPATPALQGAAIDPCSLLTDSEASTALGGPATHRMIEPLPGINGVDFPVTEYQCRYNLVTNDKKGHVIYVAVYDGATRRIFDEAAAIDADSSALPGLGDSATAFGQIDVRVFSKGTMLETYGSLGHRDGLQQIARLALAKL